MCIYIIYKHTLHTPLPYCGTTTLNNDQTGLAHPFPTRLPRTRLTPSFSSDRGPWSGSQGEEGERTSALTRFQSTHNYLQTLPKVLLYLGLPCAKVEQELSHPQQEPMKDQDSRLQPRLAIGPILPNTLFWQSVTNSEPDQKALQHLLQL